MNIPDAFSIVGIVFTLVGTIKSLWSIVSFNDLIYRQSLKFWDEGGRDDILSTKSDALIGIAFVSVGASFQILSYFPVNRWITFGIITGIATIILVLAWVLIECNKDKLIKKSNTKKDGDDK